MFTNHNGMNWKSVTEEIWETQKYVEIKQCAPKQPMGQIGNHNVIRKYFEMNGNKDTIPKIMRCS